MHKKCLLITKTKAIAELSSHMAGATVWKPLEQFFLVYKPKNVRYVQRDEKH